MFEPARYTTPLRLTAVLVVGVAAVGYLIVFNARPDRLTDLAEPTGLLLLALGLGVLLLGLAELMNRRPEPAVSSDDAFNMPVSDLAVSDNGEQTLILGQIQRTLSDVQTRLVEIERKQQSGRAALNGDGINGSDAGAERYRMPAESHTYDRTRGADLTELRDLIKEIRDLSMLSDDERRLRLRAEADQRLEEMTQRGYDLVERRDWTAVERLMVNLAAEFPAHAEVTKLRNHINHSRSYYEHDLVAEGGRRAEQLLTEGRVEDAWSKATELQELFPSNSTVEQLIARVRTERERFRDTTAQRLFHDIKEATRDRQWRRALAFADDLLTRFPNHPRSGMVREQLPTIRDNAEIEERQEQEVRIQESIREGSYHEAMEIAEDLLERFPMRPQAEAIELLLPRIRDLIDGEASPKDVQEQAAELTAGSR